MLFAKSRRDDTFFKLRVEDGELRVIFIRSPQLSTFNSSLTKCRPCGTLQTA
jgi:hypothetical protein